jgi:hypothetical protein
MLLETPTRFERSAVDVLFTDDLEMNRWWGVPAFGVAARAILLIPHFAVLWILNFVSTLWMALGWILILATGRVPALVVRLLIEQQHRTARVVGWGFFLMPGPYPGLEPGMPGPVDLRVNLHDLEIARYWGIPGLRIIVLIPQIIMLALMAALVVLSCLIVWIPILVNGSYPTWAESLHVRFLRYVAHVFLYALFVPVPYPPFWPR